jgi:hypothetical protein
MGRQNVAKQPERYVPYCIKLVEYIIKIYGQNYVNMVKCS